MKVVIVESGGTNIFSIANALKNISIDVIFSNKKEEIISADKVILPGVGAANKAMQILSQNSLKETIQNLTQPVLGICLGMQILFKNSNEENTSCLGVLQGNVNKFENNKSFPIPHMGWNSVTILDKYCPLFYNIKNNSYFYFVHSYYVNIIQETTTSCNYNIPFSSTIRKNNYYGAQFHPEKSGEIGLKFLNNFIYNT